MKLVTWNCSGALRKKSKDLQSLDADIYVVQECEDPIHVDDVSYRDWAYNCLWTGDSKNKGLGVFARKDLMLERLMWNDIHQGHRVKHFLPRLIDRRIQLLAVWTHKNNSPNFGYIGQFWKYLRLNKEKFSDIIIAGDFNSNRIWDEWDRWWNHTDVVNELEEAGFLRLILEDEKLARRDRLAKSLLTRAKFRTVADLEDWDQTFDRGISKQKLKELSSLAFYQAHENLIVMGKTGEGKTHLAVSIGRRLCRENLSVFFLPVNFLFEEVLAARTAGKYLSYVKRLSSAKVLILDDFGLRNYTHEEANVLVDILEDRHRKGPVIVTTQVDPRAWVKLFEDPVIAEAIVDRLINPAQRILLKGGSYREKLQKPLIEGKTVAERKLPN